MDTTTLNAVPEALRSALAARGIETLTPVQLAVLAAEPSRDLRISSQTGSGKTIAFGLVLARDLPAMEKKGNGPRAMVLVPTRELAQQVRRELAWLLSPLNLRVVVVTGGTSVRGDLRALAEGADVVVGTPGRLADHVRTKAVSCEGVRVVVLDEADEMLDMGFADELAVVLDAVPSERRMHLVSATFAAEVKALADRYQNKPQSVQGTPPGDANADIDHVVHWVLYHERLEALLNILLLAPDDPALIFSRTREGAAELTRALREADLGALVLTGDLDQQERQRTLELFRSGRLRILVATDVASRGLDVPSIARVIHMDPPEDPDAYTHRSGRTGRAGRKGTSHLLLPREARARVLRLLSRAGVTPRFAPVPDADEILRAANERAATAIRDDDTPLEESALSLARRLLEEQAPETLVARLLSHPIPRLPTEPRVVTPVIVEVRPSRSRDLRTDGPARSRGPSPAGTGFVRFQVSWGTSTGADPRRVLALLCRRGNVSREHIGTIVVGAMSSFVDVRSDIADDFEAAARQPDPRDPRVRVRRAIEKPSTFTPRSEAPARPAYPERSEAPPPRDLRSDGPARPLRPARTERPAFPARPTHDSSRPEPAEAPAATEQDEAPRATKSAEHSAETPKATRSSGHAEAPRAAKSAEHAEAPRAAKSAEHAEGPRAAKSAEHEAPRAAKSAEHEAPKAAKSTEHAEPPKAAKSAKVAPEAAPSVKVAEPPKAAKSVKVAEPPKAAKSAKVAEPPKAVKSTKVAPPEAAKSTRVAEPPKAAKSTKVAPEAAKSTRVAEPPPAAASAKTPAAEPSSASAPVAEPSGPSDAPKAAKPAEHTRTPRHPKPADNAKITRRPGAPAAPPAPPVHTPRPAPARPTPAARPTPPAPAPEAPAPTGRRTIVRPVRPAKEPVADQKPKRKG